MEDWNVEQIVIILTVASVTITTATLLLLSYNIQHKYSKTFFTLIIVDCICVCFCVFHFLQVYWTASDTNILDIKKLQNEYLFSVAVFAVTVGVLFSSVTMNGHSYRLCFGVYLFISIVLIFGRDKTLQRIYSVICDEDSNSTQDVVSTQNQLQPEKRLQSMEIGIFTTCSNRLEPLTTTLILEYALIYIPVSIMIIYKAQDKEWMNTSNVECPDCEHSISLCYHCISFYTIVIWIARPLYHIVLYYSNSTIQRYDVLPVVSTLTIFVILQIYIIAHYARRKKSSNDVCTKSVDEFVLEIQEKDLDI